MDGGSKGDSWPPSTPLKDIMQMMHPEMEVEGMGLGRNTPGLGKEVSSFDSLMTCSGVKELVSDDAGIGIEREFEALESVTFSDLLGLGGAATAQGNGGIGGQSCISDPNCQAGSSFSGMLLSGHCSVPGSTLRYSGNCITEKNGVSVPHQHSYDLNFPPDMEGNAVSGLNITRFAPMTPAKPGNEENNQVAEIQNLHACEGKNQERNDNEGPSQLVTDLSAPAVSTPLKDNHNSDEGGNKKKPRRRKHRPKIAANEGKKPNHASKPVASKPGGSKDNLRVKRKYVRRKGVNNTTTLSEEPSGVLADSASVQPPRNSCRRALDFNTKEQQCGSSARKPVSNLDSESRVQSKSSVQVSNTQTCFAYDLTYSVNHVLKEHMPLPEEQRPSMPFQINTNTSEEFLDVEKDQVTVHDKQDGIANNQSALGSVNDTICSTSAGANEVQVRRSKKKKVPTATLR